MIDAFPFRRWCHFSFVPCPWTGSKEAAMAPAKQERSNGMTDRAERKRGSRHWRHHTLSDTIVAAGQHVKDACVVVFM